MTTKKMAEKKEMIDTRFRCRRCNKLIVPDWTPALQSDGTTKYYITCPNDGGTIKWDWKALGNYTHLNRFGEVE